MGAFKQEHGRSLNSGNWTTSDNCAFTCYANQKSRYRSHFTNTRNLIRNPLLGDKYAKFRRKKIY